MRRASQMLLQILFAGTLAASFTIAGVARAAPAALPSSIAGVSTGVEKAGWMQRCWWVQGAWGPQQQCRSVWVEPQYQDYGASGENWDNFPRRRWRDNDDNDDDD